MTGRVEAALLAAAADGAVVDLNSLGATTDVTPEMVELAASPAAPLAAAALAVATHRAPEGGWAPTVEAFSRGLAAQRSVLALADTVDELLADPAVASVAAGGIHGQLLRDLDLLITTSPHLAATRLEAALRVALAGSGTPYLVLHRLTTVPDDAPDEYAEAIPRLIGAALDAWGTNVSLTTPLVDALRVLRSHEAATADATFELACDTLRTALRLPDPVAATAVLTDAAAEFAAAEGLDEARDDAAAYGSVCRAVTAFAAGDYDTLATAAARLRLVLGRRDAWHLNTHLPAWRQPVRDAETYWLAVVLALHEAIDRLRERSWLDTAAAIGQIARVYTAERTTAPAPGLIAIIRPAVENAVAANAVLADQLLRAIDNDRARDQPLLPAAADQLAAAIRRRRGQQPGEDDAEEGENTGERVARIAPRLERLGREVCRALETALSDEQLAELDALLVSSEEVDVNADPVLSEIRLRILDALSTNPRFRADTRAAVVLLLNRTLTFLRDRYDRGGPLLPNGTDIIRMLGDGDRVPVEADLQYEFYVWLATSWPFAGRVTLEQPRIGTGRVDVIAYAHDVRLATEVKRELDDSSPDALDKYVPQTAQYSGSSEPFSQLLVLDLTDHSNGVRPLLDLTWVTEHRADTDASPQHVIVAVVVGNRPTPRQLTDSTARRRKNSRRRGSQ
jgi:hypothetical protein